MDIKIFKQKIFEKAKNEGFTDCEIFYYSSKSIKVSIFKSDIEKFDNTQSGGVSFRGFFDNKMGYAYSEKIDDTVIDSLISYAKQNAIISSQDEQDPIYEGDKTYADVKTYYEDLEKIDVQDLVSLGLSIEKEVLSYNEKITSCNACSVAKASSELYISNTKGLELNKKSNYVVAYTSCLAKENNVIKSGQSLKGGFSLSSIDPKEMGKEAGEIAISSLNASSLKSQKYKIVFENESFTDLFSCFLSSFYAEDVQKGFSLLKNKLGQKIASDKITIADEPLMQSGFGSCSFDYEGVACFDKNVVENGVLKTYLYTLKTAKKDGVKSTGNGFKSYKGKITTSTTNFYIKNGEKCLQEIFENVKDGLFITSLSGLHAGVNSISGDFSILASGYIIKDGKKQNAVEQITIAGNFYDMLLKIEDVANDLKFDLSGVGSPSIYVGSLDVSGE